MKSCCDYCHEPIAAKVHPYTLKLELYPAVEPSLNFSEADLKRDHEAEMRRLIEKMDAMSDEEVGRQEKLVYFARQFTLCPRCRHLMADQLERLMPHSE